MSKTAKKQTAWKWFSLYIRLRDALKTTGTLDELVCITCGKRVPVKRAHAGHFIAGRHDAVLFDERMVNGQCAGCNIYHGGRPSEYGKVLESMYGDGVIEELYRRSWEIVKYTEDDYKAIAEKYRNKVKGLQGYKW